MNYIALASLLCLSAASVVAEPTISNVRIHQQWPWNAKVYIDYDITGVDAAAPQDVVVTAYSGGRSLGELPSASLRGGRYEITRDGSYRITFDPAKSGGLVSRGNLPKFSVGLSPVASTPNSEVLYKILDLTTGRVTDISRAELLAGNYGSVETNFAFVGKTSLTNLVIWTGVTNDVAYKTTQMVFRKIPAGTFIMGTPTDEQNHDATREAQHEVTLTRDFYLGVFKLTRAQWLQFMDAHPYPWDNAEARADYNYTDGVYDTYGATYMTYYALRGDYSKDPSAGDWPGTSNRVAATSFIGRLRADVPVTGFEFDLPTEAQWEYACRAGTSGWLPDGLVGDWNTRKARMFYQEKEVGATLPNAFGLYDLVASGSCGEIVLDYSNLTCGTPEGQAVTDPHGGSAEDAFVASDNVRWPRVLRGSGDRMGRRNFIKAGTGGPPYGTRIALHPDGWWVNNP